MHIFMLSLLNVTSFTMTLGVKWCAIQVYNSKQTSEEHSIITSIIEILKPERIT